MIRLFRRWRWWDRIDEHVIIGALPSEKIATEIIAAGVTAVVNTCQEYAGPLATYAKSGVEQLHLPTIDFVPPSLEDVKRGVEFIDQQITAGKQVYIHCKAGRARSATIVICWLIKAKEMTPTEAQLFLISKRPQTLRSVHRRPVVEQFYQWWLKEKSQRAAPVDGASPDQANPSE
ncbi:dual specificity protein phosphatase family protein [Blastopirellula sp. J2-11]|uniref:dual specificity protein phosphatase family protein n=1 Tax=Blastopirellula sp. J2-11 TaxID=2943192 RepID=UPI0021CA5652|nr:dual specificity protein phosphatase family protein [Blastopirellula sp. J2-11]UUO07082.1 dual specificity protein phosphatase family protein [Blastopirellula sp. J2-11]